MSYSIEDLELDLAWPDEIDPADWRRQPDPDGDDDSLEDDVELPAAAYVISILGFDPDDFKDDERQYEAYQPHDKDPGVMIAIKVIEPVASQLAIKDGNTPDQIHCTLAYLGKLSTVSSQLIVVKQLLKAMADYSAAMTGKINGLGRFGANESSDNKEVIYATLDCPGLAALRTDLISSLKSAGVGVTTDHDFTPHITLSYVEPGEEPDVHLPDYEIAVNAISLIYGAEQEDFSLTGSKAYHLPGEHDQSDHGNRGGSLAEKAVKEGGFTYNPVRMKNRVPPKNGFALSINKNTEKVIDLTANRKSIRDDITNYVRAYREGIKSPDNFLGGWVDKGKLYLDVSKVITDKREAVRLARNADQLAIFDLAHGKTISLKRAA